MKVLITGGAGFIGKFFCDALDARSIDFTILDLHAPDARFLNRFIEGDVRDPAAVEMALEGCDAVLHLAAAHHDFGIEESTYYSVNQHGTSVLTRAMAAGGIDRICFFSTVAVYGDAARPIDESTPPEPVSFYGKSKLAGEVVLKDWVAADQHRQSLIIRPTVVFGPGNFANMYTLIRQVERGRYLQVGPGTNIKSICYVENLVAAVVDLWLDHQEQRAGFEVFNYVDKPDLTSREISSSIYRHLGRKVPAFTVPFVAARLLALPFDVVTAVTGKDLGVSTARIRKLAMDVTCFEAEKVRQTGFQAPVDLVEGIGRMVRWYQEAGKQADRECHIPPAEIKTVRQSTVPTS
ncbi:MAG: NAD-dependent epimerase/dehydratase family protein [Pirellulaceae bacterium]